ncbi:MAG: hypothetical protein AVDCRST_MAG76-1875, partial [uncultured Acidimicrobiales bacterium]
MAAAVACAAGWLSLLAEGTPDGAGHERRGRRRIPLTGTVLAVATLAGALGVGADRIEGSLLGLLLIATGLGVVGLARQHEPLRPSLRISAEAVAALGAVMVGVRSGVTGAAVSNVAAVVVFLVVMTESLRLLDVGPRAAAVVVAPAAAGLGLVAAGAGQDGVAILAVALAGGLTGLLVVGTGRTFALGEHGSLFGGFLLGGLLIAVSPETAAPLSLAVLLPLVALPLLNAAVVVIDRMRRRRPLTARRPDGLPHRLRAVPLPWGMALVVLGGASSLLAALVVLADRPAIPVLVPSAATVVMGVVLLVVASSDSIHRNESPGVAPGIRFGALVAAAVVVVLAVPTGLALLSLRALLIEGATSSERGLDEARRGDVDAARLAFDEAENDFAAASRRLDHPLAVLGRALPVLGPNLAALSTLSSLGADLADTGATLATTAPQNLTVSSGTVPVDDIRRLAPDLAKAAAELERARAETAAVKRLHLLPELRNELTRFETRLNRASADASSAAEAAAVVPAMMGADGPRRYFLAIQNNAELRATGGFMGNYGELTARDGGLRLDRIGRHQDLNAGGPAVKALDAPKDYLDRYGQFEVASTWESVNLSPDFPTVAQVMAGLYPQSGGRPVDGVISVDPVGLSALLELTGPVTVRDWPQAITAENVVDVTLNRAYVAFAGERDERVDFLAAVAAAVVEKMRTSRLGSPVRIVGALGETARGGHLNLWFRQPAEQALVDRLGIAGRVDPVDSDSLLVVNQNVAGNKIDYYFTRTTSYDVQLRPDGDRLAVSGRLRVEMQNQAPNGLPRYVVGPFNPRFQAGENRTFVSVYTPLALAGATWGGVPVDLAAADELGRRVYSSFLSIPAGSTRTLEVQLEGTVDALPDGWYELDLLHQPLLSPQATTASFEV